MDHTVETFDTAETVDLEITMMNEEVLFYCLVINAVHQIGFGEASANKDEVIEDAAEKAAQAEGIIPTLLKRLQRPASQSGWGQQKLCCPGAVQGLHHLTIWSRSEVEIISSSL